jgi:hypothetical protein
MKLMIAFEFASTGEAEISLFHKLSAGNGRKPFKLAPCPRDIPLQLGACVVPVTVKFTVEDVLLPGSGFRTLTVYVPALAAFPVAVNCVAELNAVVIALPFSSTFAPLTNLFPVTVKEKFPVFVEAGLMPVMTGVGFHSVTLLVSLAVASAALVAFTLTVFGLGKLAGAVYFPFVSIVPVVLVPLFAPFTDHVTLVLDVPLTFA